MKPVAIDQKRTFPLDFNALLQNDLSLSYQLKLKNDYW